MTTGPVGRGKTELLGRAPELLRLTSMLDLAGQQGGALVVAGDAGIGKSALLRRAGDLALDNNMAVLAATGVESEANLSYAGLHQLLQPLLAGVPRLPPRLADAVLAAFGMQETAVTDRFLTALGALELLADAAVQRPQLVLIDDAQWLDAPTLEALCFLGRRIASEPIVVLIALRTGHHTPLNDADLPRMELRPLDADTCTELLDRRGGALSPHVRRRILAVAEGNPLALVELPAAVQPVADERRAAHLPLTARLQRAFLARFAELPTASRLVLLVAAANDENSLAEALLASATVSGGPPSTGVLEPAVAAGLIRMDLTRVFFRHPLVRSAVYQSATLTDRRRAHEALAISLIRHPDRRAWHLAASAIGPDEIIADEIARTAGLAETRGGLAVAVDAFARSAELSPDAGNRARRLLRAADLAFHLGAPARVGSLITGVDADLLGRAERAQLELLRTSTQPLVPGNPATVLGLVSAAETLALDGNVDLALRFLETAATQANLADPGKAARAAVSAAALRLTVRADDPRLLAILAFAEPEVHGPLIVRRATAIAAGSGLEPESAALVGASLNTVGAFDRSAPFLATAVAGLRQQGRLVRLPLVLTHQAWTAINTMDWVIAASSAEEAMRLAQDVGQPLWGVGARTGLAMLAGLRGDFDTADADSRAAEAIALPTRASAMLAGIRLTRGVAALAAGRFAQAYQELRRGLDPADPSYHHFQSLWGVGDFAEAALHSGHLDEGRAVLAELETLALTVHSPWLTVGLLYGRPLLADDSDVEDLFRQALAADLTRWPVYRARLLLQYGIWLRRQRRVTESRTPLRAAVDALETLGVTGWAARAHHELRAAGEVTVQRPPEAWSRLTAQELQIARMAADGMSNREIGQRLFLSHRTVGSHLYRLFPKLGVTSRVQLSAVIASSLPRPAVRSPDGARLP